MADDAPFGDRSFVARYGAAILRGGIAAIPSALYHYQGELGLAPQQVWFISAILAHKWDANMPSPSLKKMAEETGVSRQQLHTYERQLAQAGWLRVINRRTADGGKASNYYDFTSVFQRLEELLERDRGPAGDGYVIVEAAGDVNRSGQGAVKHDLQGDVNWDLHRDVKHAGHMKESVKQNQLAEGINSKYPLVAKNTPGGDATTDQVPASRRTTEERTKEFASRVEANAEELPVRPHRPGRGRPPKPTPSIERVLTDYSRALHDEEHTRSNVTQAMRLYRASGLAEQEFVARAAAAREIARRRGNIRKAAANDAMLRNRMPYFFRVLEDLLARPESIGAEATAAGSDWTDQPVREPDSLPVPRKGPLEAANPLALSSATPGLHGVWETTLADLAEQMVPTNYQRWLSRTSLLSHEAGAAVVGVPDQVSADQLARRFDPLVRRALADACGEAVTVRYQVVEG